MKEHNWDLIILIILITVSCPVEVKRGGSIV